YGHTVDPAGLPQCLVVLRALFVDPMDGDLRRGVAGLDQMSGFCTVGGQPLGQSHHQRVSTGTQAQVQGAGVEQDRVTDLGRTDKIGIGQGTTYGKGACLLFGVSSGRFDHDRAQYGPRPGRKDLTDSATAPPDHVRHGTVVAEPRAGRRAGVSRSRSGHHGHSRKKVRKRWRRKTERQLNLVICLLSTRRHLTAQEIRKTVQGYAEVETEQAFKRMFERDKRELRDSGIPVRVGTGDALSGEEGYRIVRGDYGLAEIELLPDEALVLGLAARAWRHAALGEAAANALFKLQAAGVPVDPEAAPGLTPAMRTDEPSFGPIWQAVRDRRPVLFDYRKPAQAVSERREVEPWGIVNLRGHWYVVGHDRVRGARRVFRLSRIRGQVRVLQDAPEVVVPEGVDLRSVAAAHRTESERIASLRVRTDAAHGLRHRALRVVAGERDGRGGGWDVLTYPYFDTPDLVRQVAPF